MEKNHETRYSLIERALNLDDDQAWARLVEEYKTFVYYLLNTLNVSLSDQDDVAQQIILHLVRDLKAYDKNKGKFRNWFSSLIRNTVLMHYRKLSRIKRREEAFSREMEFLIEPERLTEDFIQQEWEQYLTDKAIANVRTKFRGKAIEVFEMALKGDSIQQIMHATDLAETSVYKLKQRVKRAVMLEIRALVREMEPSDEL